MHKTVLAPELSATLRRLSCWIIASPGPFEDFDDPPPLQLRGGTGLLDAHAVAFFEVVDLVVGVAPGRALQGLLVPAVPDPVDHGDDHRLLHLRGDHGALADLAPIHTLGAFRLGCLTHALSPASAAAISFSRSTVRIRAISRRVVRNRAELSCWPVTIWNLRLNSSCLASVRRVSSSDSSASRRSAALDIRTPPPASRSAT